MKGPFVLYTKISLVIAACFIIIPPLQANVSIALRTDSTQLNFAVSRLTEALRKANETPLLYDLTDHGLKDIIIVADKTEMVFLPETPMKQLINPQIKQEGFQIRKFSSGNKVVIRVIALDQTGAMYGMLDLTEQMQMKNNLRGNSKYGPKRFHENLCCCRSVCSTGIAVGRCRRESRALV